MNGSLGQDWLHITSSVLMCSEYTEYSTLLLSNHIKSHSLANTISPILFQCWNHENWVFPADFSFCQPSSAELWGPLMYLANCKQWQAKDAISTLRTTNVEPWLLTLHGCHWISHSECTAWPSICVSLAHSCRKWDGVIVLFAHPIWSYLTSTLHCVPVLCRDLSTKIVRKHGHGYGKSPCLIAKPSIVYKWFIFIHFP